MAAKRTSKPRRSSRSKVLEVRVMSPRIAWLGLLSLIGKSAKFACIAAAVAGIGWGVWRGIERAFYQNPDFNIQVIDLNPNLAIDEAQLVEITEIDTSGSLFNINVSEVVKKLEARPEIASATAERHLPGTLLVRVVARSPRAWITSSEADLTDTRKQGMMLVDETGIAYCCPERQVELAASLPIIHLPTAQEHPLQEGALISHPQLKACLRLLASAKAADQEAAQWIESIRQTTAWSLELVTREGTIATFGLGDHARQIANLRASLDHANGKNLAVKTINLIPKFNIPITLKNESQAPKAVPVLEPTPDERSEGRRAKDLSSILNRN